MVRNLGDFAKGSHTLEAPIMPGVKRMICTHTGHLSGSVTLYLVRTFSHTR